MLEMTHSAQTTPGTEQAGAADSPSAVGRVIVTHSAQTTPGTEQAGAADSPSAVGRVIVFNFSPKVQVVGARVAIQKRVEVRRTRRLDGLRWSKKRDGALFNGCCPMFWQAISINLNLSCHAGNCSAHCGPERPIMRSR
jgi:hypothetical protein